MPPELSGRELDRRVAELLGWTKIEETATLIGVPRLTGFLRKPYPLCLPMFHIDLNDVFDNVVPFAEARGFWLKYTGAFAPSGPVRAGFTRHGTTGWAGRPDHEASADNPATAICRAFVALAEAEGWGSRVMSRSPEELTST